jgi:hypothetical protein
MPPHADLERFLLENPFDIAFGKTTATQTAANFIADRVQPWQRLGYGFVEPRCRSWLRHPRPGMPSSSDAEEGARELLHDT